MRSDSCFPRYLTHCIGIDLEFGLGLGQLAAPKKSYKIMIAQKTREIASTAGRNKEDAIHYAK
jgi:hypothetical protein